jgi:hypothetical protein
MPWKDVLLALILGLALGVLLCTALIPKSFAQEMTVLEFGNRTVTVQGSVPSNLPNLPARGFTLHSTDDLEIMIWSCHDPKNPKDYWYYVMAYHPDKPQATREIILIYCDREMGGTSFWADEDYLNGKTASRILTSVKKKPDLQKLLLMKKNGFKFEI